MRTNVIDLYKLNQAKARSANSEIIAMFGGPDIERDEDPEHFDMRKEANIVLRTLEVAMTDDELEAVGF